MDRLDSEGNDRQLSVQFTEKYLRRDGVFVLKLVAKNSTDLVVADIVAALWDNYRSKTSLQGSGQALGPPRNTLRRSSYNDDDGGGDDDKI